MKEIIKSRRLVLAKYFGQIKDSSILFPKKNQFQIYLKIIELQMLLKQLELFF
jgi:hypothetical protein